MTTQTGLRIIESLTQNELASLLDVVFAELPNDTVAHMLAQLPTDTGQTLEKILYGTQTSEETTSSTGLSPSLAKQQETWQSLWSEWYDVVDEAAQEEGTYMVQDEHWEPPYFDTYAYAQDLDRVADKMRTLVTIAAEYRFNPDEGFVDTLLYAETEIKNAMPEWVEIMDGFDIGESVTDCLLQWEWITNDYEGFEVAEFADRIRGVVDELRSTTLDRQTIIAFFTAQLPEQDQRTIFDEFNKVKDVSPFWQRMLNSSGSYWHGIYMSYVDKFSPEQYLDKLRPTIAQTWQNGLPVLEDLLAKQEYAESLVVVDETVESLLRSRGDVPWEPKRSLFLQKIGHFSGPSGDYGSEKILLDYYRQAAIGVGNTELVNTLHIQQIVCNHFYDWQKMFDTFEQTPVAVTTRDALYQAWRDYLIDRSRPATAYGAFSSYGREARIEVWWLDWLFKSIVDFPKDSAKGQGYFHQQMEQWLATLPQNGRRQGDDYHFLRLLTKDLYEIGDAEFSPYPQFINSVIQPKQLATKDDKSRQHYLRLMASPTLAASVMAYWRANLVHFVPEPDSTTGSNYESHASWMVVLKEVMPSDYKTLLAVWRNKHHRRRNLWRDMRAKGLV